MAFQSFPLIFIFVKSALDLVSSEMEDAANILGAGTWTAMRKVTLPMVWPSILGGAIIVFLEAVALFGTPAIIGIPARINTATTQLWQFFEYPVRVEVAAAYAMPLLLITLLMVAVQRLMLRRKGFVAQTGKGGERRPIQFGPGRFVLLAYCLFVGLLSVVLPVLVLAEASFARAWGRGFALSNLTFDNYTFLIFRHESAMGSIWHTLWYSARRGDAGGGTGAAGRLRGQPPAGALRLRTGVPGDGAVRHSRHRDGDRLLRRLRRAAVRAVRDGDDHHPGLHRRFLPIAYANAAAAMGTVHPEMEEAARILGSGRLGTIARITAPLLETQPARWLADRIHRRHPRIVDGDRPGRAEHPHTWRYYSTS